LYTVYLILVRSKVRDLRLKVGTYG
jgi:hypothetical protein